MTVFWQHVGAENSARDFPRTVGTARAGLCEFSTEEVQIHLDELGPLQQAEFTISTVSAIQDSKFGVSPQVPRISLGR